MHRLTGYKHILVITLLLLAALPVFAQNYAFTLPYQQSNHWVGQKDAKPLRDLISTVQKHKVVQLRVVFPQNADRTLYLERLRVLRDILNNHVNHSFMIEEIEGQAEANTIVVQVTIAK